jgi:hypothetical protein
MLACNSGRALAQPANDTCQGAVDISSGPFPLTTVPVDVTNAARDPEVPMCDEPIGSVWYKLTAGTSGTATFQTCAVYAPANTVDDTILAAYESADGTCNTLTLITCNDDSCGLRSSMLVSMTHGKTYYIQLAGYDYGSAPSGYQQMYVTAPLPAPPNTWFESGDAGELPASAQPITGDGPLGGIAGTLSTGADADMYRIYICDPANFSAATTGTGTAFNTQLFLFDSDGRGVTTDDDAPDGSGSLSRISNQYVAASGTYYLAITSAGKNPRDYLHSLLWNATPVTSEHQPDGPGAANPIAMWDATGSASGVYVIALSGVCRGDPPFCGSADFNNDGDIGTDADIEAFFACLAGNCCSKCGSIDFNGDGDYGTDADIEAFFRVLGGGKC